MADHKFFCGVCESTCGLIATVEDDRITKVRPDASHPNSEGFACPKGILFPKVLDDPDRVVAPQRRRPDGTFETVTWEEAFAGIGERLRAIVKEHGTESIGVGFGNPTSFNYAAFLSIFGMAHVLKTKHFYSAASIDVNGYWVVGELLYGHNLANPLPDVDRTDFLVVLGANPLVSHGSMVTLGNGRRRLGDIVKRGGRVVVIDPRRTETAEQFEHVPVRPDSDAWLLAGMLKVVLDEGLENRAKIAEQSTGFETLPALVADVDLDRVAVETGIARADIEQLARDFATAPSASIYGRCGASLGRFSTLTKYLIDTLNLVTGNLDRPGGSVFGMPFVDFEGVMKKLKVTGYDRWRTRVDGIPEVIGMSPVGSLPREARTPGRGQLRAMVVVGWNLAATSPASDEMEEALEGLDLFVSLDPYINESNRHADYVLPGKLQMEREGMPILTQMHYMVPNASWNDALVSAPPNVRDDWWTLEQICDTIGLVPSAAPGAQFFGRLGLRMKPWTQIDLALRTSRYGDWFGLRRQGLNRKKLLAHDGAIKLADGLETGVLAKRVHTKDKRVHLGHAMFQGEIDRMLEIPRVEAEDQLRLFTIRELRSQNSWLHNVPKLMSGGRACRLRIHPDDAKGRGITNGETVSIASQWGRIEVEAKVTDEVMPGSVGLNPHWGHKGGWKTAVAAGGARYNDLVPNEVGSLDALSGQAWVNGIGVEVRSVMAAQESEAEALVVS